MTYHISWNNCVYKNPFIRNSWGNQIFVYIQSYEFLKKKEKTTATLFG